MSSAALKWAKRQVIEDRTVRSVLLAIAELYQSAVCTATQSRIAEVAGLKDRAVRSSIALLECHDVLRREREQSWSKRGRSADLIKLSFDREFTLSKKAIAMSRKLGPTGTGCRMIEWDQPARDAGAPTTENEPRLYVERARSVIVGNSPLESSCDVIVSTRVRFDRSRQKWRATVKVGRVTMDLGRFDTEAEAQAYATQSEADVRRTSQSKSGTPSFPVVTPSKASMTSPNLGRWLFGGVDTTTEIQTDDGAADVMGEGATLLPGVWGEQPHDLSSKSPRARAGANDDKPKGMVA